MGGKKKGDVVQGKINLESQGGKVRNRKGIRRCLVGVGEKRAQEGKSLKGFSRQGGGKKRGNVTLQPGEQHKRGEK